MKLATMPLRNLPQLRIWALWTACLIPGCVSHLPEAEVIGEQLASLSPAWVRHHPSTYREILDRALSMDPYACLPSPADVFGTREHLDTKTIRGDMPHYGIYHGPMAYDLAHTGDEWRVTLRVDVPIDPSFEELELPDCELAKLGVTMSCEGTPYAQAGGVDACPGSGRFRLQATRNNIDALLAYWSRSVEEYFNRDARQAKLRVRYDFEFSAVFEPEGRHTDAHITIPLSATCARTPYFRWLHTGWTLPILAHEVGHVLGLLDEYEMFSGIVGFYPKTPYKGAEKSRMGLSMRENSIVLPIHHYLVLRRYFCDAPGSANPYDLGIPKGSSH